MNCTVCSHDKAVAVKRELGVNLMLHLCPYRQLQPQALCSDQKDKITDTKSGNELPPKGVLSRRDLMSR